jgi:hypothetical protein
MTALADGCRAINLAELAHAIAADHNLAYLVTEAACHEFGWPWLSIEEAIVLLGRKRLFTLLSSPGLHGRSASQFLRPNHTNRITPAANRCQLEPFQGEAE